MDNSEAEMKKGIIALTKAQVTILKFNQNNKKIISFFVKMNADVKYDPLKDKWIFTTVMI